MKRIARILMRYRHLLLFLMIALGVAGVCMLPEVKVVSDMTTYLPDDSRMKHGLDSLKSSFGGIDINGAGVSAMFTNEVVHDSLATELTGLDGIAAMIGNRSNDRYTLYQFALNPGASPDEVAKSISSRYGDSVTVETASTNLLPDNMLFIAIVCVGLLTLILMIMCASFIEAALFLIAIGIAVAINMGSNAFLPGVSVVTSAIAAILQLILSMDYSIILSNQYRQIRERNHDKVEAMTQALTDTTPPILSSAMTTILGMSMLAFMDFKIGLDMGLVLSKGVFLSLVSIYFVLPSLILAFDKLIRKTVKKVPLLHFWMNNMHCLFLDRKNIKEGLKTILTGIEKAKSGISICIFPEGTRNKQGDGVLPFHEGSFKIAEKSGVPVVPMTLVNTEAIFENHFPKVKPATVILEYGEPIYLNKLEKEQKKFVGVYVHDLIEKRYEENLKMIE